MKGNKQSPSPCLFKRECLNLGFQREKALEELYHTIPPAPLSHYWMRRDGFAFGADPIGLVTFRFPQEHDSSVCVAANASQLTSRVKDIVLI